MKTFLFEVGQQNFSIQAKDEKKALIKLINEEWDFIQHFSKIHLLGEEVF